jgi:hypothetical protein
MGVCNTSQPRCVRGSLGALEPNQTRLCNTCSMCCMPIDAWLRTRLGVSRTTDTLTHGSVPSVRARRRTRRTQTRRSAGLDRHGRTHRPRGRGEGLRGLACQRDSASRLSFLGRWADAAFAYICRMCFYVRHASHVPRGEAPQVAASGTQASPASTGLPSVRWELPS